MKILIKVVLLALLVTTSLTTKALTKAMQAEDGEIKLEVYKFILRNRNTDFFQRGVYRTVSVADPATGRRIVQRICVWAYLPSYMPHIMTETQINQMIVLPSHLVKKGNYRNNGYDANGMKQPLRAEYIPILANYSYFCEPDSVAESKTNCGNEQDWEALFVFPTPAPIAYVPGPPKGEFIYVPCLGKEIEMEPKDPSKTYQWSKGRAYVLNNGVWYYATGVGNKVEKLTCESAPQASSGSVINNYNYNTNTNTNTNSSPSPGNRVFEQEPIHQCHPEVKQKNYTGLILLATVAAIVVPTLMTHRETISTNQPVQWNGTMSNAGSTYDPNTGIMSNGGSGVYTTNGGSSNGGGATSGQWTIVPRT